MDSSILSQPISSECQRNQNVFQNVLKYSIHLFILRGLVLTNKYDNRSTGKRGKPPLHTEW